MTPEPAPEVSIVMAVYNGASTIEASIASVQRQSFSRWELIVADDGSSDNTTEIVGRLAAVDPRIRLLVLEKNFGHPAEARRRALEVVGGRYVAFLDADDLWLPEKLARQLEFMRLHNAAISHHSYRIFRDDPESPGTRIDADEVLSFNKLARQNVLGCLSVMVDTELTGPIESWPGRRDDFVMWLKILRKGHKAFGLNQDLARYRVGNKSVSSNKFKSAGRTWTVYRKAMGFSILKSLWLFSQFAVLSLLKHYRMKKSLSS